MLELFPATLCIYNCFGCPHLLSPLARTLYSKLSTTSIKYKILGRTVQVKSEVPFPENFVLKIPMVPICHLWEKFHIQPQLS